MQRESIMSTARAWNECMSVSRKDAALMIQREWEKCFQSLPHDGNLNNIPIEKQLKWDDLSRRTSRRAVPSSTTDHVKGSSALEIL